MTGVQTCALPILLSGFALVPALDGGRSPLWLFAIAALALLGFTLFHDRLPGSSERADASLDA